VKGWLDNERPIERLFSSLRGRGSLSRSFFCLSKNGGEKNARKRKMFTLGKTMVANNARRGGCGGCEKGSCECGLSAGRAARSSEEARLGRLGEKDISSFSPGHFSKARAVVAYHHFEQVRIARSQSGRGLSPF